MTRSRELVTGGARAIGTGMARLLSSTGHQVVVPGKELRTAPGAGRGAMRPERLIGFIFKPTGRIDVLAILGRFYDHT